MYIFIDTNVFFNNWQLRSPDFQYLFNYIENTQAKLIISELVVSEVENKYVTEFQGLIKDFRKINAYVSSDVVLDFDKMIEEYNFRTILEKKVENVTYIPYKEVSQEIVVKRAIKRVKPFQEKDKGYRDTLIWLSFINYLKSNNITGDVAFINNNSSDFFNEKENSFLPDLANDIEQLNLECNINIFKTLNLFIDSNVDKTIHQSTFDEVYTKYICEIEDDIELDLTWAINTMGNLDFKNLLYSADSYFPRGLTFLDFDFNIVEGIEDPKLEHYKFLEGNNIYIKCDFNVRICEIKITIPLSDYKLHEDDLDADYYDISINEDSVDLSYVVRPDFKVVYKFNIDKEVIDGLEIVEMDLYKRQV